MTTSSPSQDAVYDAIAAEAALRVAADAALSPAAAIFGLDAAYTDGTLNQPWKPAPALSGNLATAGTITGGSLPYAFTSSATSQTIRAARIDVTSVLPSSGQPAAVRILFTVDIPITSANFGQATFTVSQANSTPTTITGRTTTVATSTDTTAPRTLYKSMVEVYLDANAKYVDLNFAFPNNYTGTMTLSELDVRLIEGVSQQLMRVGGTTATADTRSAGGDSSAIFPADRRVILPDGRAGRIRLELGGEPFVYNGASVFLDSAYKSAFSQYPDQPGMDTAANGTSGNVNAVTLALFNPSVLHIGNNDLVMSVLKADASAYELRCNVHGGESGLTGVFKDDYVVEYDRGYGTWDRCHGDFQMMNAYRARYTLKTKVAHSDNGQTFANITRIYTFFPDGMVRCDRTITFTQAANVGMWFYLMNTADVNVPMRARLGLGQRVLKDYTSMKPGQLYPNANNAGVSYQATVTSTTGSGATSLPVTGITQQISPGWIGSTVTLGSGATLETRRVTATPSGTSLTLDAATSFSHSAGEPVFQNDEPTTLNTASVAGATTISTVDTLARNAYFIIDPGGSREERRHATANPTTSGTPYTITFGEPLVYAHPAGTRVQPIYAGDDFQADARNEWVAYQEPQYQAVFGQIFDRRSMTAHGIGTRLQTEVQRGGALALQKAYTKLKPTVAESAVASGTVLTDTFYWYYYVPRDPSRWHDEIATMAAATHAQRALIYPAT